MLSGILQQFRKVLAIVLTVGFIWNCATVVPDYLTPESQSAHDKYFTDSTLVYRYLMAGTENQTPLYRFHGEQEGPTVLIIGGTHGNEPAGFEAGYDLLEMFLKKPPLKGTVFLVPEANTIAAQIKSRRIKTPRGVDHEMGNLNRCYPGNSHGLPMEQLAYQITKLIREFNISAVIDLHESPVFHLEYKEDSGQYHGLGQTLIYTPNEAASWTAMVLIDEMNATIPPGREQISLAAGPVEHSAAWSAGTFFGIQGFTTETCKQLPLETRVRYQIQMVQIILREVGIV